MSNSDQRNETFYDPMRGLAALLERIKTHRERMRTDVATIRATGWYIADSEMRKAEELQEEARSIQCALEGEIECLSANPANYLFSNIVQNHNQGRPPPKTPNVVLRRFRWLCRDHNRELIDLTVADLARDIRDMRAEGCSERYIKRMLRWQVSRTIVSVVWNGFLGFLRAILPLAKILRHLKPH